MDLASRLRCNAASALQVAKPKFFHPLPQGERINNPLFRLPNKARRTRGVSLIELAIVLGVIGIIAASIWAAATAVHKRQPIQDASQLVVDIAAGVKNVYAGHAAAVPPANVAAQIADGLFPQSVVNAAGTGTVNPWGGSLFIQFPAVGNPLNGFSIVFTLPASMTLMDRRDACIAMVSRFPGSAAVYAGGLVSNTLPAATIPLVQTESGVPALTLLDRGAWGNVTGVNVTDLFPAAGTDCEGFAFYFRI